MTSKELKTELRNILDRHIGRDRAITGDTLAKMVRQGNRQVRQAIEELIDEGLPVISTSQHPAGYFIPTSLAEAKEHTESLRTRALALFVRSRQVRRNTALYLGPALQKRLF